MRGFWQGLLQQPIVRPAIARATHDARWARTMSVSFSKQRNTLASRMQGRFPDELALSMDRAELRRQNQGPNAPMRPAECRTHTCVRQPGRVASNHAGSRRVLVVLMKHKGRVNLPSTKLDSRGMCFVKLTGTRAVKGRRSSKTFLPRLSSGAGDETLGKHFRSEFFSVDS